MKTRSLISKLVMITFVLVAVLGIATLFTPVMAVGNPLPPKPKTLMPSVCAYKPSIEQQENCCNNYAASSATACDIDLMSQDCHGYGAYSECMSYRTLGSTPIDPVKTVRYSAAEKKWFPLRITDLP